MSEEISLAGGPLTGVSGLLKKGRHIGELQPSRFIGKTRTYDVVRLVCRGVVAPRQLKSWQGCLVGWRHVPIQLS
ncbi:hypothetical protein LZF95_21725 [Algoriphagus sp. AGSA1]|uniref:hypothetical protein n=1 Tax=Algoriphagus sp. AGSA1 TaxID=2907213 RepID=UPI001F2BBB16|nr:hypothetical protein [Algoriphagus sp. AGSA1]MCE7057316.1 hypothetical protein [Algoriphagus sp. AGSA1]